MMKRFVEHTGLRSRLLGARKMCDPAYRQVRLGRRDLNITVRVRAAIIKSTDSAANGKRKRETEHGVKRASGRQDLARGPREHRLQNGRWQLKIVAYLLEVHIVRCII